MGGSTRRGFPARLSYCAPRAPGGGGSPGKSGDAEQRYRDLFFESHDAIVVTAPDGRLLDVNPAAVELFEYESREQMLESVRAEDLYWNPSERRSTLRRIERDGTLRTSDLHLRTRGGRRIVVWVNSTTLKDERGRIVAYRAILRDMTAVRELEAQVRQSQKIEAVGRLAGGVAHDFNNLLTVIGGCTELLLDRAGPGEPSPELVAIHDATERATTLTRQLLAFSRRQELEPEALDLGDVVEEARELLLRLIGEHIEIEVSREPELDQVFADRHQLQQVVLNLAINARDAMQHGGRLTVDVRNVRLDDRYASRHVGVAAGPYVRLSVSDNGTGIPVHLQPMIFDPFFTTKPPDEGTGLGLSTVYGIVKQSGGRIWVYSEPGEGTTFKIYLPRFEADAHEWRPTAASGAPPTGDETILLVEDDNAVRAMIVELLQTLGYEVLEAATGEQALSIVRELDAQIDLLLTDLTIPEIGGGELAERVEALRPSTKTLYVSGHAEQVVFESGLLESGKPFIEKPFTLRSLAFKLREALER